MPGVVYFALDRCSWGLPVPQGYSFTVSEEEEGIPKSDGQALLMPLQLWLRLNQVKEKTLRFMFRH